MGNRIFVAVVLLLWASTMSWLVVMRILPPFFQGEPPRSGSLLREEPVCWQISYGDKQIGHAVSQAVPGAMGTTEVHSRVLVEEIDVREMAPQWMGSLVRGLGNIQLDVRSRLAFDALGSLTDFDTRVRLNDLPTVARMRGRVRGPELELSIQSGDVTHEARYPVPAPSLLTNELIPAPKLLHLYVGRKWQQEMFSPFRPPHSSLELLQAEVVAEGPIDHRGQICRAKKIEFRSPSAAGVATSNNLRAAVWVEEDGTVLRQDVYLMNAKLRFERCREPAMLRLAEELLDLDIVATMSAPQRAEE